MAKDILVALFQIDILLLCVGMPSVTGWILDQLNI